MIATIAICGPMKFFPEMEQMASYLRTSGLKVYLPEAEESEDFYTNLSASQKPMLKKKFIDAHLEKIKHSEAVLICNYSKHGIDGYIGPNTLLEVAFAYALNKKIVILNHLALQPCKDEIDGLDVTFIDGDLSKLLNLQNPKNIRPKSDLCNHQVEVV